jgi:hypothetical protein
MQNYYQMVNLFINIKETKKNENNSILYKIQCSTSFNNYFIFKSYSEFLELHNEILKLNFKDIAPFPPKIWIGNNQELKIKQRIDGLSNYLFWLTSSKNTLDLKFVQNFFYK